MDYVSCIASASTIQADSQPEKSGILHAHELFPEYAYDRPVPTHIASDDPSFAETIGAFYAAIAREDRSGTASYLVEFGPAMVSRSIVYFHDGTDFRIVYETYRPNDRGYTQLVGREELESALPVVQDGGEFLYLGSVGSFNYGHWLVDDLPRLHAFQVLRARRPDTHITVVIPGYSDAMNKVRVAGIQAYLDGEASYAVLVVDPESVLRFDRLNYCTPVTYHPVSKSPFALNAMAERLALPPALTRGSIFVDRRRDRGRVLTNIDSIRFRLEMRGFQSIDPETLTFDEQRRVFGQASVVVGCMGAAMTNTVFCRPGTRLVYLAPEGWTEPFYWDLAAVRGHVYSVVYGAVVEPSPHIHLSDYVVPWRTLLALLPPANPGALAAIENPS